MIVRILNDKQVTDKFYDCRNSCIKESEQKSEEFLLILEFTTGETIEVLLGSGDKVYYMNNDGNTIHADCRACK